MTRSGEADHETTDEHWLGAFISACGAIAGTVHRLNPAGDLLLLQAAVNIPPPVREHILSIPRGKGMAGLAWERGEPISTCNLKTDATGNVRSGAKAVAAQAGVALPLFSAPGVVRAVVGVAFREERDITPEELDKLSAAAQSLSV